MSLLLCFMEHCDKCHEAKDRNKEAVRLMPHLTRDRDENWETCVGNPYDNADRG